MKTFLKKQNVESKIKKKCKYTQITKRWDEKYIQHFLGE